MPVKKKVTKKTAPKKAVAKKTVKCAPKKVMSLEDSRAILDAALKKMGLR
jgi:hypothetical protein